MHTDKQHRPRVFEHTPCPACGARLSRPVERRARCRKCGARLIRLRPDLDPQTRVVIHENALDVVLPFLRQQRRVELERARTMLGVGLEIQLEVVPPPPMAVSVPATCARCAEDAGRRFTLDEALRDSALPHRDCLCQRATDEPEGICRCAWKAIVM